MEIQSPVKSCDGRQPLDDKFRKLLEDEGMVALYEFSLERTRRSCQNEHSHKFTMRRESKVRLGAVEQSRSQSRLAAKYRDVFGSFWDMPAAVPPLSPEVAPLPLPRAPATSPAALSTVAEAQSPPGGSSYRPRPRIPGKQFRFSRPDLCPRSPPATAAASKRGIGQRLASFFRGTAAKKIPRNQRIFTRGYLPTWKLASPMPGRRSSGRFSSMRDRIPAFIRKSLRRRSCGYAVNPRPRL